MRERIDRTAAPQKAAVSIPLFTPPPATRWCACEQSTFGGFLYGETICRCGGWFRLTVLA